MPNTKRRRAYIGNLRPRPNLSHNLYNNLFLPHGLHVKNYPPVHGDDGGGGGGGIVVAHPKMSNDRNHYAETKPSSFYALVEFTDVGYAIQMLNGVQFDGRTLRVSREKTNFGSSGGRSMGGGGFGSSRWAGDDGGGPRPQKGKRKILKASETRGGGIESSSNGAKNGVSSNKMNDGQNTMRSNNTTNDDGLNEEESIIRGIDSLISSEIKESSDEITAAIACTAAMALLTTVDAFGFEEKEESASSERGDANVVNGSKAREYNGKNVATNNMTNQDFQLRCKLPMSELQAEYGEQDVDWKKQQPHEVAKNEKVLTTKDAFQSRCQMPLSELMAEYGEQDTNWKKDQAKPSSTYVDNNKQNAKNDTKPKPQSASREHKANDANRNGMLASFGKASIHVELVSFGYKYGAPSHSKRGFTYAHPLPPMDVRDLDRAPGHVAKFTGLSHLVKRALLNPPSKGRDGDGDGDGNSAADDRNVSQVESRMRRRANEIADEIITILVESIDEGGHGAVSPLTMTVSIGSEYGRHRGVVLVEHLAVVLRARLRRNDGRCFNDDTEMEDGSAPTKNNGIVQQPVSVGTRHRDVDARHRDEEAFGEDLKREARKSEKQMRRRQMDDDAGWDDAGW